MKRLLIFLLLVFCRFNLNAQVIKTGLNTDISAVQSCYKSTHQVLSFPGLAVGIFAEITPDQNSRLSAAVEIDLSRQPETYKDEYGTESLNTYSLERRVSNYVSVPFVINYSVLENKLKFSIGQEISYLLKTAVSITGTRHEVGRDLDIDLDDEYILYPKDYNPWGAGIVVGAEYMIHKNLGLRVRCVQRISNGASVVSRSNRRIQAGLSWYF